ncbi:MAG: hypothetical protein AAFY71_14705 [Bacteroidota bacterium]
MSFVHVPPTRPRPQGRNRPLEEMEQKERVKAPKLDLGKFRIPVKSAILYPAILLVLAGVMYGVYSYQDQMPLKEVNINWLSEHKQQMMDEEGVMKSMLPEEMISLTGIPMNQIDLAMLENNLNQTPSIKHAEVYKSFMGVLNIDVELREAVGRMVNNSGRHLYVDAEKKKFPVSALHTAYVPLVRGDFDEGVVDTFSCETISDAVPVLEYIHQNEFWNAQIAEVIIAQNGELTLLPSIGDMNIAFGYPDRIEEKFSKLMDFYKQVIPVSGWRKYRSVSLKYKGQVIGKKR